MYNWLMNATLTIRLREEQRRQLRELASRLGKSDSELVREMGHKVAITLRVMSPWRPGSPWKSDGLIRGRSSRGA
jgi:hypothetical protein